MIRTAPRCACSPSPPPLIATEAAAQAGFAGPPDERLPPRGMVRDPRRRGHDQPLRDRGSARMPPTRNRASPSSCSAPMISSPCCACAPPNGRSAAARDIAVTLVTADGTERQPAAAVHGRDLIDIAFGTARRADGRTRCFEPPGDSHRRYRWSACRCGGSCLPALPAWFRQAALAPRCTLRPPTPCQGRQSVSMLQCVNRCETSLLGALHNAARCQRPGHSFCFQITIDNAATKVQ